VRVLITNDDGIDSPGLHTLAHVAGKAGLQVVVAAPHVERSGTSASLVASTADGRLLTRRRALPGLPGVAAYAVEATPAYITWVAVRGAFGEIPDLVLSGINNGPNTGHAVLHSGTVGAALTALAHGVPAMAVSVNAPEPVHWDTAAGVASRVLGWLLEAEALPRAVVNVNLPDVPASELRGVTGAPLASFGAVQADVVATDDAAVVLTFSEVDTSRERDSDAGLLAAGWATVTALAGPCQLQDVGFDGLLDDRRRGPSD
jgi:5'-nucleotidase